MIDRQTFYEQQAPSRLRSTGHYYQKLLRKYFGFLVPPGLRVLELGCGVGDLLAALKPGRGVGIDFSPEMIKLARERHPGLEFHVADAAGFSCHENGSGKEAHPFAQEKENRRPGSEIPASGSQPGDSPEKFDYILLSDLVNDLPDVQAVLERLHTVADSNTRLVVNFFNN